jgi:methylated-DNA-[protein]-cysteine S-methyltransferase
MLKELNMALDELIQYYYSDVVGWLELRVSSKGVRSISFTAGPAPDATLGTNPIMDVLIRDLDGYFSGRPKGFSVPLDPSTGTAFHRKVWKELTRIPYGETRSYGEIAAAVGVPRGARAVGLANKRNCIPILIPCHRVIKSDGGLGGYDSGLEIKQALLQLEGVKL